MRATCVAPQAAGVLVTHSVYDRLNALRARTLGTSEAGEAAPETPFSRLMGNFDNELNSRLWEAYGTWVQVGVGYHDSSAEHALSMLSRSHSAC